jgi:hypothetical protein
VATTTNFGWTTPDNTGYVKDGALAIRTLGSAIDSSMVDLKGGASGQYLKKASATDMDFQWVTLSASPWSYIGGVTSTSGSTVAFTGLGGTYKELLLTFNNVNVSAKQSILFRLNSDSTSANYNAFSTQDLSGTTYLGSSLQGTYGCVGCMTTMYFSSGAFKITNAQSTGNKALELNFKGQLSDWITSSYVGDRTETIGGTYSGGSAISSINIALTSGSFTDGSWKLWGMEA